MPIRERRPGRIAAFVIAMAIVVGGCDRALDARSERVAETAPPGRLADLRSSGIETLDARDLAEEAIDPAALVSLLRAAGMEAAVERSYAPPSAAIRRVEVRVVRFGTERGAERYLGWQVDHVADVTGDAEPVATAIEGVTLWVHVPEGCCAKEQAVAIAAWRDGTAVVRILVAGPGADDPAGAALVERLHGSLLSED